MSMPSGVKAMSCGGTGVVLVGPVTVAREFRAEGRAETGRRVGGAAVVGDSEDCWRPCGGSRPRWISAVSAPCWGAQSAVLDWSIQRLISTCSLSACYELRTVVVANNKFFPLFSTDFTTV